jgi:hypothetical protein
MNMATSKTGVLVGRDPAKRAEARRSLVVLTSWPYVSTLTSADAEEIENKFGPAIVRNFMKLARTRKQQSNSKAQHDARLRGDNK